MSTRSIILLMLVCLVAGAAVDHRYTAREVIKTVEHVVTKDKIVTVVETVKAKDGSEHSKTTITEDKAINDSKKIVDVKAPNAKDWMISTGTELSTAGVQSYSLNVQRRVLGPIFLGLSASSSGRAGVTLGAEF